MKKIRGGLSILIVLALILSSFVVSAASSTGKISYTLTPDFANNKVTISGEIPETAAGAEVGIIVLKSGQEIEAVSEAPTKEAIVYFGQMKTKKAFSFTMEYFESNKDSYFQIYSDGCQKESGNISLIIATDFSEAAADINNMAKNIDIEDNVTPKIYTDTEFADYVKQNDYKVGFDYDITSIEGYTNDMYVSALSKARAEIVKTPITDESQQDVVAKVRSLFVAEALNQGIINSIRPYTNDLSAVCMDSSMKTLFNKVVINDLTDNYFVGKIKSKNINGLDSFKTQLQTALIFTSVRYGDGPANAVTALTNYGSLAGITSVVEARCRGILGQDFATLPLLKDAYDAVVLNPGGGGATGGGGGGTTGNKSSNDNAIFPGNYQDAQVSGRNPIEVSFDDMGDYKWASVAVIALADKGIISGKGNGLFAPGDPILREEFVKMIVELLGLGDEKAETSAFVDVTKDDWFYHYVNVANKYGLCKGVGNGKFGTGAQLSRQDMCVILSNALKLKQTENIELPFEDLEQISDYAIEAVGALYKLGVVNGVSETHFDPRGIANRAQAAKVIYGVLDYL